MTRQNINHGTTPGDGTGETLFSAFAKVNANETELYSAMTEAYANKAAFPVTGTSGKLYLALDTGISYWWTGAIYAVVGSGSGTVYPAMFNPTRTGFVDPATGALIDRLSLPGAVPSGMSWLSDTLNGFDIYAQGFVKHPTIFFDPSSTNTARIGTFNSPYTTQADLMGLLNSTNPQDMSGQVIGIKRGTQLNVSGLGLVLYPYASVDDPLVICPYGDADALPIISGQEQLTGWTLSTGTTYQVAYTAGSVDVWYNGIRLQKKSTAGAVTQGTFCWASNVLTVWLPDNANPNNVGAALLVNGRNATAKRSTILLAAPNKASAGSLCGNSVIIAGLDICYGNNAALRATYLNADSGGYAAAAAAVDRLGEVTVVGCKLHKAGVDNDTGANSILNLAGINDSVRLTANVVGNYIYDGHNNGFENTACNGGSLGMKYNQISYVGNAGLIELYGSNSNWNVKYNYTYWASGIGMIDTNVSGKGAWQEENHVDPATGAVAVTSDDTVNSNNVIAHNLIVNVTHKYFFWRSGSGIKVINNTCIFDPSLPAPGFTTMIAAVAPMQIYTAWTYATHTPPASWLEFSNNLFAYRNTTGFFEMGRVATERLPIGDNNITFSATNNFRFRTTVLDVMTNRDTDTAWKAAVTPLDANSKFGDLGQFSTQLNPTTEFTHLATTSNYAPDSSSAAYHAGKTGYNVLVNAPVFNAISAAVAAGGTGYAVGDVLTVAGGTVMSGVVRLQVLTVSAGAVTSVGVLNEGQYSAIPTNPASVTGGTGASATFTLSWVSKKTKQISIGARDYTGRPYDNTAPNVGANQP